MKQVPGHRVKHGRGVIKCLMLTIILAWVLGLVYFISQWQKGNHTNTAMQAGSIKTASIYHLAEPFSAVPSESSSPHGPSTLRGSAASKTQSSGVIDQLSSDSRRWHRRGGSEAFNATYCSPVPAADYPIEWPILDIVGHWNPDSTRVPSQHHASLCRFDYQNELKSALAYREAEVPFIVSNVPALSETVVNWADRDYLRRKFNGRKYMVESSKDNHFVYSSGRSGPTGWKPAQENVHMSFDKWLEFADQNVNASAESPHWYFRTDSKESTWLARDLSPLTVKGDKDHLFIVDQRGARGIYCRFGMAGINAGAHFDGSRNFVAVLGGLRRYFISAPKNCVHMALLPKSHPSGRHSEIDWSKPDLTKYPNFPKAQASEVILAAGDLLYIPSGWIHYVMSLNTNWQCNARSGKGEGRASDVKQCGF